MKIYKSILFLVFTFFSWRFAAGQVAYYNFNSAAGLPSNEVYFVYQDRDGYLWFGTDHGLVKYNGYNFKTYTTADGLTDNTILACKEDDEGRLWLLTLAGGICYYDGKYFLPHPSNDTIISLCNQFIPTSWEVHKNKVVWLGFMQKGFYKITPSGTKAYLGDSPQPSDNNIRIYKLSLSETKYVYTALSGHFSYPVQDDDVIHQYVIPVARNKFKYTGMNFGLHTINDSLYIIATKHSVFSVSAGGKVKADVEEPGVLRFHVSKTADGNTWLLSMNSPLYCLGKDGANEKLVFTDSFDFVRAASEILLDKQGNYWITTLDNGIYLVPNRKIKIFQDKNLMVSSKVLSLAADSQHLSVGLANATAYVINKQLKSEMQATEQKSNGSVTGFIFQNGKPLSNLQLSAKLTSRGSPYISQLLNMRGGLILAGGGGGFIITDGEKFLFDSRTVGLTKRVTSFCELSKQRYAIGTISGFYYLDIKDNMHLTEDSRIRNIRITACKKLNASIFAVATRGSGVYLNSNGRFYRLNEKNSLISDLDEDIYFENDSVFWVATYKGLARVNFRFLADSLNTKINYYTKEDGLCSNQINAIAGFGQYIFLATNEGLCYFKPGDLSENVLKIPLFTGNIYVNGLKRNADSLELKYNQNNILIEFTALYYKAISGIRYKVRLNGSGSWIYINQNFIEYFNLMPGDYTFEVAAEDARGKYISDVRHLHFTISRRFTDTAFFVLILVFAGVLIIGIILYQVFRYERLKAQNIIHLLKAEFKALNYQINPHFIFNVLNSIQYYILRKDSDKAVHFLNTFSLLIRRIVNNSKQQYISVLEEIESLQEYLGLEKLRLDGKFAFEINIDSRIDIEQKLLVPMIIQPLVENSIWHGIVPSGNQGKVKVDFKKEGNYIICVVDDNGIGLRPAVNTNAGGNHLSMAMVNVRERLKIISEINSSSWYITIKDKHDIGLEESGVIVTVQFPEIKENRNETD